MARSGLASIHTIFSIGARMPAKTANRFAEEKNKMNAASELVLSEMEGRMLACW